MQTGTIDKSKLNMETVAESCLSSLYHGINCSIQMPPGFHKASGTIDQTIDLKMSIFAVQFVLEYLAEIVRCSKTGEKRIDCVHKILIYLLEEDDIPKLMIFRLFTDAIHYFWKPISPGQLEITAYAENTANGFQPFILLSTLSYFLGGFNIFWPFALYFVSINALFFKFPCKNR